MIHPNTLNEIVLRIASLKQQLAESQAKLAAAEQDVYKEYEERLSAMREQLAEAQKDTALWRALCKQLWVACPTTLECRAFHHAKQDQHRMTETCRPQEEYLAAIDAVNQAMREGE